jgi:hypothetical protein
MAINQTAEENFKKINEGLWETLTQSFFAFCQLTKVTFNTDRTTF